ncbi:hypothetical protein LMB73_08385 [Limosilactobacillus reuteri]|uniref:hypothetical protein n=1 Tax=Limosilactobacillus reuteri TaxID=1598 RepID=UPI001E5BED8A|nr:hypothetical protein [Limosilactobacillus reuteri]MCC4456486.1 hypothetical protein [Limosilactobacillus reuteri]MCC4464603.1 hypothetical protein [Limosilactobacillus reuteri]
MIFDVFIKKLDEVTLNDMHFSAKQSGDWLEVYLNHGEMPAFKISLTETFRLVTVGKICGLFDEWKKIADLCWEFASTPIHERFVPYMLTTGAGDEKLYFKLEVINSGKTVMVVTSKPEVYRDFILKSYQDTDSELKKLINLTKEVTREGLFDEN